jgi:nucleotide-binding universal stress UspA family protein
MTDGVLFVVVAGSWLAIGLMLSLLMGRRGHDAWSWLVLGTLLGPFAIALAIDAARHRDARIGRRVATGTAMGGPVDVLVGIDGSPESDAAAVGVLALFGPRLGRVTLAAVVPYDTGREVERAAERNLAHVERHFEEGEAEAEVLHGRPSESLGRFAREAGYDLLAIGTRGTGRTKTLLGSTAVDLARASKVPVLMFGGEGA